MTALGQLFPLLTRSDIYNTDGTFQLDVPYPRKLNVIILTTVGLSRYRTADVQHIIDSSPSFVYYKHYWGNMSQVSSVNVEFLFIERDSGVEPESPRLNPVDLYAHCIFDEYLNPESRVQPLYLGQEPPPKNHQYIKEEGYNHAAPPVANHPPVGSIEFWHILLAIWEQRFLIDDVVSTYGLKFFPRESWVQADPEWVHIIPINSLRVDQIPQMYCIEEETLKAASQLFRSARKAFPHTNLWGFVHASDMLPHIEVWQKHLAIPEFTGPSGRIIGSFKVFVTFARVLGFSQLLDRFTKISRVCWLLIKDRPRDFKLSWKAIIRDFNAGFSIRKVKRKYFRKHAPERKPGSTDRGLVAPLE